MSKTKPKTIAITGATGFVGSHLVRSLSNDGYLVKAFGRSSSPPARLLKYAKYYQWDINQIPKTSSFGSADVFIHAAGFVNFWGKKPDIYQANVTGTQNAAALAKQMGAKTFIYLSSASVYDPRADKLNIKESAPYAKRYLNYYAASKVQTEKWLKSNSDFQSIVIIRPHIIYGPGDRTLIPRILSRVKHKVVVLPDSGSAKASITHVGNIVDAVRSIIKINPKGVNVLNITDSEPVKGKTFLANVLKHHSPNTKIIAMPYSVGLLAAYVIEGYAKLTRAQKFPLLTVDIVSQLHHASTMSNVKAQKLIGYKAKHSYPSGLDDTFEWIDSLGGLDGIDKHRSQLSWSGKIKGY